MTLSAIAAIAFLELVSFSHTGAAAVPVEPISGNLPLAFGAAMTPVLFAYGGWQTSSFLGGEIRDAQRVLPRALVLGVIGVIAVYVSVNVAYLRSLGPAGLAATSTPASTVMRDSLGARGAQLIAAGIAFSAFGFLAQSMLSGPRVYFAMAKDGVFFRQVARVHPRTHAPVVAILLQGSWAIVIALSGTYGQVVNYVVAMDSLFFGLTAACLFVLRRRIPESPFRVPGHPWTTLFFITAEWLIVISTFANDPRRALIGLGFALLGLPVYLWWR
jgi:APA family basic amino acid/polyamine antiporter